MHAALESGGEGRGEEARVFAWHFEPVMLSGVVAAGDEAELKAALAALMQSGAGVAAGAGVTAVEEPLDDFTPTSAAAKRVAAAAAANANANAYPYHAALINLYIHYGSVRVESNGDCSVLLRRVRWLNVCEAFGDYSGDSTMANELFDFVNELRDATLQSTRVRLLHSGMGLLHSQTLSLSAETSLKLNAFSLSEFTEGIIRCACSPKRAAEAPESPLRRLKTRAQRAGSLETSASQRAGGLMTTELAVRQVKRMLDHVVVPHARQLGLAGSERVQADMSAAASMKKALLGMCPMHASLFERYSTDRSTSGNLNPSSSGLNVGVNDSVGGGVVGGVSIGRFLAGAEILAPQLGRARLAHAFVQSLPVGALLHSSAARVLSPASFQQALVRLALMVLTAKRKEGGGGPDSGGSVGLDVGGCDWGGDVPLSELDATQLIALREVLVAMQAVAAASVSREATPRAAETSSPEDGAVLAIQKRFRGHHTRRARKGA